MYQHPDPVLRDLATMLGLPANSDLCAVTGAIQALQRDVRTFRKSAENWASAYHEENRLLRDEKVKRKQAEELQRIAHETSNKSEAERQRAMDPQNWRATFTGDDDYTRPLFTHLTHGNQVTIEGTGQILFHFHPCCESLDCQCNELDECGHCKCHTHPDHR